MNQLQQKYTSEVVPSLMKKMGYDNAFAVPRIRKIVVNMGVTNPEDVRARLRVLENISEQFEIMTGQKPQITKARQSIANFKIRTGDPLGIMVTLRGQYMWEFLQKLIMVALPRVKDFRGVPRAAFDGQGNYSMGVEEQIVFPEIDYDKIEAIRSFQVVMVTTAQTNEECYSLLEEIGLPFEKEDTK